LFLPSRQISISKIISCINISHKNISRINSRRYVLDFGFWFWF
jgi:hypothetical protein